MSIAGDAATVTVTVAVPPADAFRTFVEDIDLWWGQGPRYRLGDRDSGALRFEPRLGGRLFETFHSGSGAQLVEFGRITAWEPPLRLSFEWRNANFAPTEKTQVDIAFERIDGGTRVTLRHSGWAALRGDHPARHGLQPAAFIRMTGLWWGELLSSYRARAASTGTGYLQ